MLPRCRITREVGPPFGKTVAELHEMRQAFPDAAVYDLLEADTFRELSARPESLRQTLSPRQRVVIVDEIQKLPALLNEIQVLIDRNKDLRVILTGSSARKLWRGGANLLGGRAWTCRLHLQFARIGTVSVRCAARSSKAGWSQRF